MNRKSNFSPRYRHHVVLCVSIMACLCVAAERGAAWGCEGHMLVAEIARRHLTPTASQVVDAAMRSFSENGPFPLAADMVQAACWLDDVKGYHQYAMNAWHYADEPFVYNDKSAVKAGNGTLAGKEVAVGRNASKRERDVRLPAFHADSENIKVKLLHMVNSLRSNKHLPRYMIEMGLVHILHLMGDIHQPLHCAALVSDAFPKGDRGGNEIIVRADGIKTRLHSLWDKMGDPRLPKLPRPLSKEDYDILRQWASQLEERYGPRVQGLVDSGLSPKLFALESYRFAVNTSYSDGVAEATPEPTQRKRKKDDSDWSGEDEEDTPLWKPMELSKEYLKRSRSVSRRRVVLAGLRLADILNTLFPEVPDAYVKEVNKSSEMMAKQTSFSRRAIELIGITFNFFFILLLFFMCIEKCTK